LNPILILDCETSGFDPRTCGIVEIGAVFVEGDRIADESYSSLCWPGLSYLREDSHWKALTVSGINPALLLPAPETAEVLRDLFTWAMHTAGEVEVTSYNVKFDRAFIEAAYPQPVAWGECLMQRARSHLRLPRNPSLARACQAFGIAREGEHRALADARSAAQVMLAMEGRGH
jgi:DNA polymerase III subunit epsilon